MKRFLVGGAVRDRLLGLPVAEQDWVVVGATPETMVAQGYRPVGRDFPVFLHPDTHEEHALARTERKSGHGYHGFTVHTGPEVTLEDDLWRRDLTVNAIAEDEHGALVDPHGGRQDLDARQLRHVSPAFAEDPLRVLRVARFAARYAPLGFTIAPQTMDLMRQMVAADEVDHLTPERVWKETERALLETGRAGLPSPACVIEQARVRGWPDQQVVTETFVAAVADPAVIVTNPPVWLAASVWPAVTVTPLPSAVSVDPTATVMVPPTDPPAATSPVTMLMAPVLVLAVPVLSTSVPLLPLAAAEFALATHTLPVDDCVPEPDTMLTAPPVCCAAVPP